MRSIVVDSGPLIALFDGSDQYHELAVRFLRRHRSPLISNLPVVTEVVYVLDFSSEAQRDFLSSVGCSACQGYLIGRPMPVGEFEAFAERIFAGVAPALGFVAPFKPEGSVPGYAQAFPQGA